MKPRLEFITLCVAIVSLAASGMAAANPFEAAVLDVRPRIFLRDDAFAGLTLEKLRACLANPDFAGAREKWRTRPLGRGLLWMLEHRKEDLDAAVAGLRSMNVERGTWSDRGLALVHMAALFDWLYRDLDVPVRHEVLQKIEAAADDAVVHLRGGQAPFFYSRTPGALAGVCVAGLALHGVSNKAESYVQTFRELGVDEYFKAYEWVDGSATGATYTLNYTFVDLPSICAAWWSATGRNPADWIRREQGDWLDGMVRFYLWYLRPGFAFTDINDQFRTNWQTHDEFCQGLDIASYVTRNGFGRAWSQRWRVRFGRALYHPEYAHNLIFRDTDIPAKSLHDLPRAELFGRDSCGYGFFRSDWPKENEPDLATHVFFRCGDPMDVHGGVAAGEFQIFRHAPLAARSGRYASYDSPPDQYHRNCISTNVVLFTDPGVPDDRGDQNTRRGMKTDHRTWAEWLRIRERNQMDVAQIVDWQIQPGQARCRADLTKTNPGSKCQQWIREFVWLADKHLIVLDVVQTTRPEIRRQWQLHAGNRPVVGDHMLTVSNEAPEQNWAEPDLKPKNRAGMLFCQTLLPRDYRIVLHSEGTSEAFAPDGRSLGPVPGNAFHRQYGGQVIQIEPGDHSQRTVFLHVLTATESGERIPVNATVQVVGPMQIEVAVGDSRCTLTVPEWFTVRYIDAGSPDACYPVKIGD